MTIELPMTVCAPLRGDGTFSMPAMCFCFLREQFTPSADVE